MRVTPHFSSLLPRLGLLGMFLLLPGSAQLSAQTTNTFTQNGTNFIRILFTNAGSSNNWTVPAGITNVTYLAVGGGGGGGGAYSGRSGGGGGGAVRTNALTTTPGAKLAVVVGAAGAGGNANTSAGAGGKQGGTSVFGSVTAPGGGGGAGMYGSIANNSGSVTLNPAGNGASGGGGAAYLWLETSSGSANGNLSSNSGSGGMSGSGFSGGNGAATRRRSTMAGFTYDFALGAGGGGGAGGAGGNAGTSGGGSSGQGGAGISSSLEGSSKEYGRGGNSGGSAGNGNGNPGAGGNGRGANNNFAAGSDGAAGIVVLQHIDLRPTISVGGTATLASKGVGSGSATANNPVGATPITQRGFLVSLASVDADPMLGESGVLNFQDSAAGAGAFTTKLTGLLSNENYVVKPYALNTYGVGYGTAIPLDTRWYEGLYIQDFQAYTVNTTTDLNDGSIMSGGECDIVTHANIAGGAQKVLRLLNDGTQNARNAFFLPDLNPGQAIRSFRVSFDVHFMDSAGGADNLAINFGTVPLSARTQNLVAVGPQGNDYGCWSSNTNTNGPILSVVWDAFNNGSTNRNKGTRVVLNGNLLTNNNTIAPHVPNAYDHRAYRRADIVWEDGKISVAYNGQVLCSNLPTTFGGTNFVPLAGDIFCFTAASGLNDMHASIDNLRVETSTQTNLPVPAATGSAPTISYGGNRSLPLQQAVTIQPTYGGGPTKAATAFSVNSFAGSGNRLNVVNAQGTNAQIMYPAGLAVDRNGFVYAAESAGVDGTGRHSILKISPEGLVWTLAGSGSPGGNNSTNGPRDVTFNNPTGVAVDTNDNVYVADCDGHRIRRLTPAGAASTFAGGTTGLNDGTGTSAQFDYPEGICIDPAGQYLYVAQSANDERGTNKVLNWGYHSIRRVTISNAVVTTIAGNVFFSL